MNDKYYIFYLDEPAMPGFCSFSKMYVGTKDLIFQVAANLTKRNSYPETVKAIYDYFNGNHNATHNIAYNERKVLTPIKILAEHNSTLPAHKWTHTNIWGFPYEMKCDSAKAHQIVFKHEKVVYRHLRVWFENLCYENTIGEWTPLDGGFWGNASILDVANNDNGFIFNNLLFVEEQRYDTDLEAALADLQDTNKLEFKKICDEIFADG